MHRTFSQCLQLAYKQFDTPADQIIADPELQERFTEIIRVAVDQPALAAVEVMRSLLTLRKNGRLARLRR